MCTILPCLTFLLSWISFHAQVGLELLCRTGCLKFMLLLPQPPVTIDRKILERNQKKKGYTKRYAQIYHKDLAYVAEKERKERRSLDIWEL